MKARYSGQCSHCYGKILPGQAIGRLWAGQPFMHAKCVKMLKDKMKKPVDPSSRHPGSACGA